MNPLELAPIVRAFNAKTTRRDPLIGPFVCGEWACPGLASDKHREAFLDPLNPTPAGLVLIQDWGDPPQLLASTIQEVDCGCRKEGRGLSDRTLKTFFPIKKWQHALHTGEWLVPHVARYLQPTGGKRDYLGDEVHRATFPEWLKLLTYSAVFPTFKLLIAGKWGGVIGNEFKPNRPVTISNYLNLWIQWMARTGPRAKTNDLNEWNRMASQCQGTVHRIQHPKTWRNPYLITHDWHLGPLPPEATSHHPRWCVFERWVAEGLHNGTVSPSAT